MSDIEHSYPSTESTTDMGQILVAVATKIGAALAEALVLRLVWQLWAAYARRQGTATVPAAA